MNRRKTTASRIIPINTKKAGSNANSSAASIRIARLGRNLTSNTTERARTTGIPAARPRVKTWHTTTLPGSEPKPDIRKSRARAKQPASKDHWLMAVSHAAARRRSPSWMHESVPVRDDAHGHVPKGIPLLETDL